MNANLMDATGLWFSKLERNFSSEYGQFHWTEEQRIWDWDKLTTVELVKAKDGTRKLILRRKGDIHTRYGRPDNPKKDGPNASLRYMLGIDIDEKGPEGIECDYYTAKVYDHYKNRWNLIGPKKRLSFQIGDNAWLWQWADDEVESSRGTEETTIGKVHKYITNNLEAKNIVYTNIFNLDVDANHKLMPVVYQPAVDAMKNFVREINYVAKLAADGRKEVEITLVFNNEELRKHKILNRIYEIVRQAKYGRFNDIESFVITGQSDDDRANGFSFKGIYSGNNDLEEDTIHGDREENLPPHRVRYYANNYNHPIIFVNTSNHALAEHDTNPDIWKWEYVPWVNDKPFISEEISREMVDERYKSLPGLLMKKLLNALK